MAQCETGYFCRMCGEYVPDVLGSELYLRFVLGEADFEQLYSTPDAHIGCVPSIAQYIVHDSFEPVNETDPDMDKRKRDPAWVAEREERVTKGWLRLQKIPELGIDIDEYPLDGPIQVNLPR